MGEMFGAAAFAVELSQTFAKGGAEVLRQFRGSCGGYVAGFAADEQSDYIFFGDQLGG